VLGLSARRYIGTRVRIEQMNEAGFALVGLLVTLLLLCGLAVVVLAGLGEFTNSPTLPHSSGGGPTSSAASPPAQPGASAVAACNADAKVVETAVTTFEATNNGAVPTISDLTSSAGGGPYLQTYPRSEYFTLALDANGNVTVSLSTSDPAAANPYLYPTDKPPFAASPVPYDTWTWSSAATLGTRYPARANVCAGA
jgi:competence protein ComGC